MKSNQNNSRQKGNIALILIVIALFFTVVYQYLHRKNGTLPEQQTGFAVTDTSAITKVFLADKRNNTILLEKVKPGEWNVNRKFKARNNFMDVLLGTMAHLSVKNPVAKTAVTNVINRMAAIAVKVEVYTDDDEPDKVYYVGDATQDGYGTYMLMEGDTAPYIIHIPGFYGYLTPRYSTNEDDWRERTVFAVPFKDIDRVTVDYPQHPEWSFSIANTGNWNFTLSSIPSGTVVPDYDTLRLRRYLVFFSEINFESFVRVDSIRQAILKTPVQNIISVKNSTGTTATVKSYLKPLYNDTVTLYGNSSKYDPDRMYALVNDSLFVTIQYFVFDKLFMTVNDFYKQKDGKDEK